MANHFDERELSPIFADIEGPVREVLGESPSKDLLARLKKRHGRRSRTEQPSIEMRKIKREESLFLEFAEKKDYILF